MMYMKRRTVKKVTRHIVQAGLIFIGFYILCLVTALLVFHGNESIDYWPDEVWMEAFSIMPGVAIGLVGGAGLLWLIMWAFSDD